MKRYHIINHLINFFGYENYLEIGVNKPEKNFNKIIAKNKDGVDPGSGVKCNFNVTSDDFFERNKDMYDIIFIDGLHEDHQVMKDIENSLKFLSDNGTIVVHDCNPQRKHHQCSFKEWSKKGIWNGTVWKAFVRIKSTRPDLYMKTVDCDYGVGIIRRGEQELLNITEDQINYEFFRKRKQKLLGLISAEEFLREFK